MCTSARKKAVALTMNSTTAVDPKQHKAFAAFRKASMLAAEKDPRALVPKGK